jgi:hypothetical protein
MFYRIKRGFKVAERVVAFGASSAATVGLLTAVYAFVYPAKVAQAVVGFQDLMMEARDDLGRLVVSNEVIADQVTETAQNTDDLAKAIPFWVTFDETPFVNVTLGGQKLWTKFGNPSPYPITMTLQVLADGAEINRSVEILPPRESMAPKFPVAGTTTQFEFCLAGTSNGFPGRTLHERRVYLDGRVVESAQGFEPIAGCDLGG